MAELAIPTGFVRLDDGLVARLREGRDLGRVSLRALVVVLVGGALYGAAFGAWRGPEQAVYVAIKLPLLLLAVGGVTLGANALLAALLGSRLSVAQSAACALVALAITATVLGAMAPISLFLALNAPPPDPSLVGLAIDDPRVLPSLGVARSVLLWHVVVVAGAGIAGVVRLGTLLRTLVSRPIVARRVFWAWLVIEGLSGAELSWLFRPFLGKPHLPPGLWRQEALQGNFFEEASTLVVSVFGASSWMVAAGIVIGVVGVLSSLRQQPTAAHFELVPTGVRITPTEGAPIVAAWSRLVAVHCHGVLVSIAIIDPDTMARDVFRARLPSVEAAEELAERMRREQQKRPQGAFRTG